MDDPGIESLESVEIDRLMNRHPRIEFDREALAALCRRHHIKRLAFFGSVLRDDFGPDSDVDFLVTFAPNADWTLLDLVRMEHELEDLLGREVDLVEKSSVEASHNPLRRRHVLATARVLHGAG